MNVTSRKLNLIILFVFFVATQSSGQNLDTVKIIKDIRGKYKRIVNSKGVSPQIIYTVPEGVFDIYEGDTMELDNPFDGGYIEIYRNSENKISLLCLYESYTATMRWSTV